MYAWKRCMAAAAVAGMLSIAAPAATAQADAQGWTPSYTAASIRGDYAVVASYGANVAQALGTQAADGHGNLRGSALVNQPGANGSRKLSRITFTGTYTVAKNGTGKFHLTLALPGGNTADAVEDFVITKIRLVNGTPVATEIVDAQEEASHVIPGGVFVSHTYTRRPD